MQGNMESLEENETSHSLPITIPKLSYYFGDGRNCDDAGLPLSINCNKQDQILRENGETPLFAILLAKKG
ncbi:hypothetical protein [Pseudomonas fluorescens]|uniref:hypothetical protein n=1 Tax=Pseudomonas fluorescens TaxID=294 RepID=UPI0011470657|nr:hypothetical protein [Pseudomonas fluorescens]